MGERGTAEQDRHFGPQPFGTAPGDYVTDQGKPIPSTDATSQSTDSSKPQESAIEQAVKNRQNGERGTARNDQTLEKEYGPQPFGTVPGDIVTDHGKPFPSTDATTPTSSDSLHDQEVQRAKNHDAWLQKHDPEALNPAAGSVPDTSGKKPTDTTPTAPVSPVAKTPASTAIQDARNTLNNVGKSDVKAPLIAPSGAGAVDTTKQPATPVSTSTGGPGGSGGMNGSIGAGGLPTSISTGGPGGSGGATKIGPAPTAPIIKAPPGRTPNSGTAQPAAPTTPVATPTKGTAPATETVIQDAASMFG